MKKLYSCLAAIVCVLYFSNANAQVVISELNYHSDSTQNASDWVELWNSGASSVDISGWKLVDGNMANPPFTIPGGTTLASDARLVLVDNTVRFDALHPGVTRIGPIGFEFANSGEQITLKDNNDLVKIQFTYDDSLPWNKCADGLGRTLELINPSISPTDPTNWRCGCIKGSPGTEFQNCTNETLLISEINYNSPLTAESGDWIEIWNKTNGSLNLSGYRLRDDNDQNFYTFPTGTTMGPQARLVIYNDAVNFTAQHATVTNKIGPFGFGLSGDGDAVRLYNSSDKLIQSLWFDEDGPWCEEADGNGATLELSTTFDQPMDISASSTWFCGCPAGSPGVAFVNSCGLGTDENITNTNFNLWPNPATDVLYFNTQGVTEFKIISIDGKVWNNGKLTGTNQQISIFELPAGIYVLSLSNASGSQSLKWIKQ